MVHEEHDGLTELEALVAEGLELETADRETWLDTLSEHSAELGDEVRARLRLLGELGWSRASDPAEPRRLGRFVLVERIGLGGMGEVWRAEDGERTVAIKLVRPELLWFEGARRRFQREIQAVSALDHSGIVRVLEVGDADGVPWMALEWIDGLSLESLIELLRHRPPDSVTPAELLEPLVALAYVPGAPEASAPPPSERTYPEFVAGLLAHVAEALEHAHARGVIHRDVKPSNILVTARAHTWLADFGLAFSREGSRLTRTGSWLGSLPYASPEQVEGKGELDERADVYSLGATLYEALTLRTPFLGGSESSVRARVLAGDLPPVRHWNPGVPRSLELVCAKAMDRDPARRYAGAAELARDLRNVAEGRAVRARALPPWLRVARAARRRPRLTVVLLAAVVVVATLAAWGLRERHLNQQVRRMADTELMARLERDSLALLPIDARRLPLIEDWLARARDLLARSELHAAELEDLRAAALPHDDRQAVEDAAPARARLLELRLEVEGLGHFLETRSSREDLPLPLEAQRVQVAHEHWSEQLRDAPDDFLDEFLARIAGLRSFAAGHTVPSAAELDQLDAFEAAVREHEALLDQRRSYRFAREFDQWRHDELLELVRRADGFRELVDRVAELREKCRAIDSLGADVRASWARATAAIASSPLYAGLELEPSASLLPLEPDPASGLWEFLVLGTGQAPERGVANRARYTIGPETGIVLVLLPAGSFEMGPPEGSAAREARGVLPRHRVELAAFFLSKYELTAAQALRMGTLPREAAYQFADGARPLRLGWQQSLELIEPFGLQHPTEAQWEYAARAGSDDVCNGADCANLDTASAEGVGLLPVGSLEANAFGLHDCLGNVREWCRDWMVVRSYSSLPSRPGDGLKATALQGPGRVVRGGSFADPREVTDPYRRALGTAAAAPRTGVRPVMTARP